jgi:hypothetical protein
MSALGGKADITPRFAGTANTTQNDINLGIVKGVERCSTVTRNQAGRFDDVANAAAMRGISQARPAFFNRPMVVPWRVCGTMAC